MSAERQAEADQFADLIYVRDWLALRAPKIIKHYVADLEARLHLERERPVYGPEGRWTQLRQERDEAVERAERLEYWWKDDLQEVINASLAEQEKEPPEGLPCEHGLLDFCDECDVAEQEKEQT